jgi:hypothetical protein
MKRYSIGLACLLAAGFATAQMPSPEEMVKQFDKNSDGFLSKEELAAFPMPIDFDKADTNKDGKLDAAEFDAYMKTMMGAGGPPGGPPSGPPPASK